MGFALLFLLVQLGVGVSFGVNCVLWQGARETGKGEEQHVMKEHEADVNMGWGGCGWCGVFDDE